MEKFIFLCTDEPFSHGFNDYLGLGNKKELQPQIPQSATKKFIRIKTEMLMGVLVTTECLHYIK